MAREPKSYMRTVTNGQERLQVLAVATKTSWSFYVLHQELDGKKFSTVARGASARYPDFNTAKAAVDATVQKAVKIGWPPRELSQSLSNLARNVRPVRIYDPKLGRKVTTEEDVARLIESFLDGTCGRHDWDAFCTFSLADAQLDEVRRECCDCDRRFPPDRPGHYCNDEGVAFLRDVARRLRQGTVGH